MVHQLITIAEYTDPDDTVWNVFDRKLEAALQAVEVAVSIRLRPEMGNGVELVHWLEGWNLRFKQQNKTLISIAESPAQQQCLELSHPNLELVYISSINEIPKMLLKMTQRHSTPPQRPTAASSTIEDSPRNAPQSVVTSDIHRPSEPPEPPTRIPAPESTGEAPDTVQESIAPSPSTPTPAIPPSQSTDTPSRTSHSPETGSSTANDHTGGRAPPEQTVVKPESPDPYRSPPPIEQDWSGYNRTVGNSKQVSQYTIIEISGEYRCNNCGATRMFCKGDVVDRCENRECSSSTASFTLLFDLF